MLMFACRSACYLFCGAAVVDVQGYVHVPMMYEEDLFIRQNLFSAEYKPSQVSP